MSLFILWFDFKKYVETLCKMQLLLQEKSVQSEAAEGSAEKNHDDDDDNKDEDQDGKPAAEEDDDDDDDEEFDSSDEQILTKSGKSSKDLFLKINRKQTWLRM